MVRLSSVRIRFMGFALEAQVRLQHLVQFLCDQFSDEFVTRRRVSFVVSRGQALVQSDMFVND